MVDAQILGQVLRQTDNLGLALARHDDNTDLRGKQLFERSPQAGKHFVPKGYEVISPKSILAALLT